VFELRRRGIFPGQLGTIPFCERERHAKTAAMKTHMFFCNLACRSSENERMRIERRKRAREARPRDWTAARRKRQRRDGNRALDLYADGRWSPYVETKLNERPS
jgi:hypothetical protein